MEEIHNAMFDAINRELDVMFIADDYDDKENTYNIKFNLQKTPENLSSGKNKIESLVKKTCSDLGFKYEFNSTVPKQLFFNRKNEKYVVSITNFDEYSVTIARL